MSRTKAIWLTVAAFILGFALNSSAQRKDAELFKSLEIFGEAIEQIMENYVEEVEPEKLIEGAMGGMLSTLDPHCVYLPPDIHKVFQTNVEGVFEGIGIIIALDEESYISVISPIEGTPAFKAGVMAGDRIIKIEDQLVSEVPKGTRMIEAMRRIRGEKGTPVTITVLRQQPEGPKEVDITIVRGVIHIESIKGVRKDKPQEEAKWQFMLNDEAKIGYIRIASFSESTADDLDEAVRGLRSQGMEGLILDLRFNPGGLLDASIEVADRFIEEGTLVYTKDRRGQGDRWEAKKAKTYAHFPLVVLINEASASASEIVAGAIQDHHRGVLVGSPTYGKGSVQKLIPLQGERGALKLTISRYYLPSGKALRHKADTTEGRVVPDVEVALTSDEKLRLYQEWRYQDMGEEPEAKEGEEEPAEKFTDRQLEEALETLRKEILVEAEPNV